MLQALETVELSSGKLCAAKSVLSFRQGRPVRALGDA